MKELREYCSLIYEKIFEQTKNNLEKNFVGKKVSESKISEFETLAQKEAIKISVIEGMKKFPEVEASIIWRAVYETHIHRKSGISDAEIIAKVVSADQSWKKSSGHAFEEMIKFLGNNILSKNGIEIILQRDLNNLIKENKIDNEPRDISWLKEQIKASIFDLYAVINFEDKKFCYGCIQSKTSIRDRVTRDREPSIKAMKSFFWSVIIVLDGDFLKLPKFISMVNGGSSEYEENGWHGMYVFSNQKSVDRIYPTDLNFKNFKEHAIEAANYWLKQRQWFDINWKAE